ncbi:MAG: replication-relaxation family protein [Deltaproteobacteria bacterium]|nr:replication-relaxation family protein [Deltaproteobacteria bacterium]
MKPKRTREWKEEEKEGQDKIEAAEQDTNDKGNGGSENSDVDEREPRTEGEENEEQQRSNPSSKRRSPGEAVRLSPRGAFILCELYKLRRMTLPQLARLCVLNPLGYAPIDIARRLKALGYVRTEDHFRDGKKIVLSLTEPGRRFAADRLGRSTRMPLRDDAGGEFTLHTLKGVDLYLRLVCPGARDWLAVRKAAARFDWYSSNEGIDIDWRTGSRSTLQLRRLIPDWQIETHDRRIFIEIERSTKSLAAVKAKVEHYSGVLGPFGSRSLHFQSAYFEKYRDQKQAIVAFVFDTPERTDNVQAFVKEALKRERVFVDPIMGTEEDVVQELSQLLKLHLPINYVQGPQDRLMIEMRKYIDHINQHPAIPALAWPPNWRELMSQIYPRVEWRKLRSTLDARVANAVAAPQNQGGPR